MLKNWSTFSLPYRFDLVVVIAAVLHLRYLVRICYSAWLLPSKIVILLLVVVVSMLSLMPCVRERISIRN